MYISYVLARLAANNRDVIFPKSLDPVTNADEAGRVPLEKATTRSRATHVYAACCLTVPVGPGAAEVAVAAAAGIITQITVVA